MNRILQDLNYEIKKSLKEGTSTNTVLIALSTCIFAIISSLELEKCQKLEISKSIYEFIIEEI